MRMIGIYDVECPHWLNMLNAGNFWNKKILYELSTAMREFPEVVEIVMMRIGWIVECGSRLCA